MAPKVGAHDSPPPSCGFELLVFLKEQEAGAFCDPIGLCSTCVGSWWQGGGFCFVASGQEDPYHCPPQFAIGHVSGSRLCRTKSLGENFWHKIIMTKPTAMIPADQPIENKTKPTRSGLQFWLLRDYPRPEGGGGEQGSHLQESCGSFCSHRGSWEAFMKDEAVALCGHEPETHSGSCLRSSPGAETVFK